MKDRKGHPNGVLFRGVFTVYVIISENLWLPSEWNVLLQYQVNFEIGIVEVEY